MAYQIRLARLEELPALTAIERAASQRFRNTAYAFIADSKPMPEAAIAPYIQQGRAWVGVDEADEPVGWAIAQVLGQHVLGQQAYLKELDVLPTHGRRGLGRTLVETVCQWAQHQGCREMTLSTFRDVPWNAPFYAKLGFRLIEDAALTPELRVIQQQEADYGLPIGDRVFMSRTLG